LVDEFDHGNDSIAARLQELHRNIVYCGLVQSRTARIAHLRHVSLEYISGHFKEIFYPEYRKLKVSLQISICYMAKNLLYVGAHAS
jgi:hypothetical protein